MDIYFSELNIVLHYMVLFFILVIIFEIIFYLVSSRKINNKNIGIYGILMSFDNVDLLKVSLLVVCYLVIIELIILTEMNYYVINFILIPIISFEILNKSYAKIIIDILEIVFIYFILIFKNIFFAYLSSINMIWYIVLLYIIICGFILLFNTYFLFENINILMNKKVKTLK